MDDPIIDKSITKTVSLPALMWDELENFARSIRKKTRSAYIRDLYLRDRADSLQKMNEHLVLPIATNDNAFALLTKLFRPAYGRKTEEWLQGLNTSQAILIEKLIEAVVQIDSSKIKDETKLNIHIDG